MNSKTTQQTIALTGVLVPDNWQENGEVSGLALLTNDEGKYILDCSGTQDALMAMLRERVRINGLVSPDRDDVILVTSFSLFSEKNN